MAGDFFLRRVTEGIFVLFLLSFCIYILIGLMPGDPIDLMVAGNPHITPEDALRLKQAYGLDQPLYIRYGHWLMNALQGDLGYSRLYAQPVLDVLIPRMGYSAILMGATLFFTLLIALPLGVYAAAHKHATIDKSITTFCLMGISVPSFWMGILGIAVFSVTFNILPAGVDLENPDIWYRIRSAILPVATLTLASIASYIRHLRSTMIDCLGEQYIQTARAKGCSKTRILWRHAFRNALPPIVTLLMLDIGVLFSGALTLEIIFTWPGMGKLMFDAIMGNDYNLALSGFLFLAVIVITANMLADMLYPLLDPRQKKDGG